MIAVEQTPILISVLAPVGVVATAYVTWKVAQRKTSGKVDTSTADSLWEESRAMRLELRQEASQLKEQVEYERRRADNAVDEVLRLTKEVNDLRERLIVLEHKQEVQGNGG